MRIYIYCLVAFLHSWGIIGLAQNTMSSAVDLGIKSEVFNYSSSLDTKKFTNDFRGLPTNDVFYKFTLAQSMDIIVNHCGSELNDTYLYILSANGSVLYENNDDFIERVCPNRLHSYLKIKGLSVGTYFVVSEGVTGNGDITTTIQGLSTSVPISGESLTYPISISSGLNPVYKDFTYSNERYVTDYYNKIGDSGKDIFYKVAISVPMNIIVSHQDSKTTNGSRIYFLSSKGEILSSAGSSDLSRPSVLEMDFVKPGTYYVVSETSNAQMGFLKTNITGTRLPFAGESFANPINILLSEKTEYIDEQNIIVFEVNGSYPKKNTVYYSLDLSQQVNTIITVSNCHSLLTKTFIEIYAEDKTQIYSSLASSDGLCSVTFNNLKSGRYYIVSGSLDVDRVTGQLPPDKRNIYLRTVLSAKQQQTSDNFSMNKNYILNILPTVETPDANNLSSDYSIKKLTYYDALGRKEEEVQLGITPNKSNLFNYLEYDKFGRLSRTYLPVIINNNGEFNYLEYLKQRANTFYNDMNPHTWLIYESSFSNRIQAQYGPGQDWHKEYGDSSKAIYTNYLVNLDTISRTEEIAGSQFDRSGLLRSEQVTLNPRSNHLQCIMYKVDNKGVLSIFGYYASGQLSVTYSKDENGNTFYDFKDEFEQIVLSRRININKKNQAELLDTYYVYDNFGNLRFVLPPLASDACKTSVDTDAINKYAYSYQYDQCNRCVWKKLPDCEPVYYIYDKADQLIFTQDGEQRAKNPKEWTFSIPDVFGRIALIGICKDTISLNNKVVKGIYAIDGIYKRYNILVDGVIKRFLSTPTILSVNYYDNYDFRGMTEIPSSTTQYIEQSDYGKWHAEDYTDANKFKNKGLLTGTLTAEYQPDGTISSAYLYSVMYYDSRERLIQTKSNNHLGGIEEEYIAYNFVGQPLKRKHVHSAKNQSTQTEIYSYTYDHAGRLLKTAHQLNGGTSILLTDNEYDELGRLKANKRNGHSQLKANYTYNIRSWMKSITSPLFNQVLYYNELRTNGTNTPYYNGNISGTDWSLTDNKSRGYNFTYDNLSRLTKADYLENNVLSDKFSTSYSYDKHGNILSLTRHGNLGTTTYGLIDNLVFSYRGNQLLKVEDAAANPTLSMSMDFKDGAHENYEYSYDRNGNQINDLNKGISYIEYNSLNLPRKVSFVGANNPVNEYVYSSDGRKLAVIYKSSTTKRIDYVGNMIYENGSLKQILVDGGYLEDSVYHYYLQDHLGNNRVVSKADGTVVQTNHYYPFGMSFSEGRQISRQTYKYNDKELDIENGLNWYDYKTRQMDATGGRFITIDPLSEKYYSISPYVYCADNPLKYIDPDGKKITLANNYIAAMNNIAQIAATSLGSLVMEHLIGKEETYTMNSTYFTSNSSYDPSNRTINYVGSPYYDEVPYDGGALNSMIAMGHESFHAFDHSNNMFNSSNVAYRRDLLEPRAVSFGNNLRQSYSLSPLRKQYSSIKGEFQQFGSREEISNFSTIGNNSDKTSFGFSYVKTTEKVESYTMIGNLKIPDKTTKTPQTYYMIVSMDKNKNITINIYDNKEDYGKATQNWK